MTSTRLAQKLAEFVLDKKGIDVSIMDLRKLTDVTDYFVLVSSESETHAKAICDYVEQKLKKEHNMTVWHKEGYKNLNWIILDFVDVVLHILRTQTREFYQLEKLWGDARIIRVEDDVPDTIVLEAQN